VFQPFLTVSSNNITTITQPPGYEATDNADGADGLFKKGLTQGDFGPDGLSWDFDETWDWKEGLNLPVLKARIFSD
jgi:hypothetical protein